MKKAILLLAIVCFSLALACNSIEKANLVLFNGKVATVDDAQPLAQAIAIRGTKIIAVGSNAAIKSYQTASTRKIDLAGRLAIPGFIDSHGHFSSLGESKMQLDLTGTDNWSEIVAQVKTAAEKARSGDWIVGRGWHQEKWNRLPEPNVAGLPLHQALSTVSPHNPVLLRHASGHSCIANAKAMELAGVSKATADPAGGEIVRDSRKEPIGVFRETAQALIRQEHQKYLANRTPAQKETDLMQAIELASRECLSKGITSFHDAWANFETIDFYKKLAESGKLNVRLWVMIGESNSQLSRKLPDYKIINAGDHKLTVRAIKRFIDGALGAHGAWLLQPYTDLPTSSGLNTTPLDSLSETARLAINHGFQFCTHAIGDRGNREALNIYEKAFQKNPAKKNLRWRIEHAQHLHPDDIPRFAQLGVTAAMQGIHCTSDGPWVPKRIGNERAREGAYVWQKLLKTGAVICNGTDVPVEAVDPIACFYASVTRRLKDGAVFFPEQKMSREQALRSYTLNGAYAAFEEHLKGSLTPGKLADITVLSQDILTIPDDEILNTQVDFTIAGGEIKYQRAPD